MDFLTTCTCVCDTCGLTRQTCIDMAACPDGPTGDPSGSCPVDGWMVEPIGATR